MSTAEPDAPDKKPKDTQAPQEPPNKERKDDPQKKYVFKILPADPKNAFDFEDVADK